MLRFLVLLAFYTRKTSPYLETKVHEMYHSLHSVRSRVQSGPFNSAPINHGSTNFTEVWKPHPNTRGRKGDTQQVPYRKHTNIRLQSKNIIRPVDLVPEI